MRDSHERCDGCNEPALHAANATAAQVFLDCATQWRVSHAGATGLDYAAVAAVMRIRRVGDSADCLARVQVLEREVLAIHRERAGT